MVDNFKWVFVDIPRFALALRVPNFPGQDTSKINKMTWQMKIMHKVYHMVYDRKQVLQLWGLVAISKDSHLIAPIWGKQVKPSNVIVKGREKEKKTLPWQIKNLKSFTKHHVNFHANCSGI